MAANRPSRSWVRRHLLVVVSCLSFVMMTLLVVQQERIIDAQRNLIRQLFDDSMELSGIKMHRTAQKLHPATAKQPAPAELKTR